MAAAAAQGSPLRISPYIRHEAKHFDHRLLSPSRNRESAADDRRPCQHPHPAAFSYSPPRQNPYLNSLVAPDCHGNRIHFAVSVSLLCNWRKRGVQRCLAARRGRPRSEPGAIGRCHAPNGRFCWPPSSDEVVAVWALEDIYICNARYVVKSADNESQMIRNQRFEFGVRHDTEHSPAPRAVPAGSGCCSGQSTPWIPLWWPASWITCPTYSARNISR